MSGITFVNSAGTTSNASGVTTLVSATYAATKGNMLIIVAGAAGGSAIPAITLATSTGNPVPANIGVSAQVGSSNFMNQTVWVIPNNNGTAGTWTANYTQASDATLEICEYSGASLQGLLEAIFLGANGTVTQSIVDSHGDSLIFIAGLCALDEAAPPTVGHTIANFNQRIIDHGTGTTISSFVGDVIAPAAGTYSDTQTWSGTSNAGYLTNLIFAIRAIKVQKLYANGQFYASGFIEGGSQVTDGRMKLYSNTNTQILNIVEPGTNIMAKLYANGTFATNNFSEI